MEVFVIQNDDRHKDTLYVEVTQGETNYTASIPWGSTLSLLAQDGATIVKFLGEAPAS